MPDPIFDAGLEIFTLIITALIYVGIFINIFTRRGLDQILFIIAVIGYFFILFVINDFFVATTFIAMWFVLTGTEFFLPKQILLGIFAIMLFVGTAHLLFYLLAIVLYTITVANFIFSSFRRMNPQNRGS